jgi:bidirectional [NiFe] hydrogenase diaphorase subunit
MEKLMTFEELEQIASEARAVKEKSPRALNVCVAAGCLSLYSEAIKSALDKAVQRAGANCRVRGTVCMGLCSLGPLVSSEPDGNLFKNVAESDATEIVAGLDGTMPERLLYSREQPFFQRQTTIVLENSGRIDPVRRAIPEAGERIKALLLATQ